MRIKKAHVVIALIGAFALGAWVLCDALHEGACSIWPSLGMEDVKRHILDAGPWGVLVSIGLMVAHSFVPFPSEVITIANGMVYGVFWGTVISWVGAMLGALVAFGISRKLGQKHVERFMHRRHMDRAEQMIDEYGTGALLFVRLIPVFSFNLINYLVGLTKVPLWTFIWTTAIGMLPMTILMSVMGHKAADLSWQAWAGLLAGGLALWYLVQRVKGASRK